MAKPFSVTESEFAEKVISSDIPVLVDFWADWCAPCKMIAPSIEELSDEYDGKVKFAKVDVDANPKTAMELSIRGIPALFLFKDGQIADSIVGAVPKSVIKGKLDKALEE